MFNLSPVTGLVRRVVSAVSVPVLICSNLSILPAFSQSARQTTDQAASKPAVSIPFEKYRLNNGLEVILSPDHRLPLVAVNLWYHVGAANERADRTGFAHLFEHMMFEGSRHVGAKAHFKHLEAAGASTVNGSTVFDRTNYFETLPSNQLELALWLESDRMGFLLDTLDSEKLKNQRDVVRNERREGENYPYQLAEEVMFHELFPKPHPYYAKVIGSHADIEAARLSDVRDFFKQYYCPNNASLVIAGDFDRDKTRALVEKYFGSLKAGPAVPPIVVTTPPIASEKRVTVTDQVVLPRVYMAWITPGVYKAGDAEADLVSQILGQGKSSRLYKNLVYEKQLAQDVWARNHSAALGSVFMITATARSGVKIEELEKALNAELAEFNKNGPTQEELEGARNVIETDMVRRLERLNGVADKLNQYNHYVGDPDYLARDIERYERASIADLKAVTSQYLQNNSRVVVYAVPGKKVIDDVPRTTSDQEKGTTPTAETSSVEPWRANPPAKGPDPSLVLPVPSCFQLDNGLKVYLTERHNLPVVSTMLTVLSGNASSPAGKPGLASFTGKMLEYGTEKRSASKVADELEQVGTDLHIGVNADRSDFDIITMTKTTERAFDVLSDLVCRPVFDEKEIERLRADRLTSLLQEKDSPDDVARRVMYKVLYGDNCPYGCVEEGTPESVKAITRDDLLGFYRREYTPANSALFITGDLNPAQARALAEKYFGQWKGSAVTRPRFDVRECDRRTVYLVNKEAAPQTTLKVACVTLSRNNPDWVPADVMNTLLGGMFSSRLNMNLREKNGYTYGVHAWFADRRAPGPYNINTEVRTDITAPAVSEIFKEIERMKASPPDATELRNAKNNMALSLSGQFETTRDVNYMLNDLFVFDLPLGYYSTLPDRINAVTDRDVVRIVDRYLNPQKMSVIAIGDRAKIKPELSKLNLGKIQELDCDANPINTGELNTDANPVKK